SRGAGPDVLRPLQPQRAGRLRTAARHAADARRPLYAPRRPHIVSRGRRSFARAVRRPWRMGAQGHHQRGQLRQVLERPNHRRIGGGHLAREAVSGLVVETAVVEKPVDHTTRERGTISPLAGKPAPKSILVDLARLEQAYYEREPDTDDPTQLVTFGTS